ncbi:MAG TPA: outer membrane protein assembly factor BamA [Candidatus Deferrimicrobiaceae bacterium]
MSRPARLFRIALAAMAISLLPGVRAAGAATNDNSSPVIRSVAFQVASPYLISYQELMALVTVRPGVRYEPSTVRESIRRLYDKAVFREISAWIRPADGGVDLVFFLLPMPVVSDIEVKGQDRVTSAQILSSSRLKRGVPIETRDLADAEQSVRTGLRQKGFPDASVEIRATCNVENGSGRLLVSVSEGKPGKIRSIAIKGTPHFPEGKVKELLGVEEGDRFDFRKWDGGVKRLRQALKRDGFLTAHISAAGITIGADGGLTLAVTVDPGTRYEVRFEGAAAYSVGRLEKASGLYNDEETTEGGLLYDARDRLLAFYRARDYSRVRVDLTVGDRAGDRVPLTVAIREGEKGFLKEIRFAGNASISSGELRRQMTSRERGVFHLLTGSGDFQEEEWADDVNAIVGLYQKEGFVRARVLGVETDWDDEGRITKTIHIEEGARYRLREIRFQGNNYFLRSELLATMGNKEKAIVDYVALEREQETIASKYRDAGFLDADAEAVLDFDPGTDNTVVARFVIREGIRYRLGKTVVRGNVLTDAVVVQRELQVKEGVPLGEKELLKFQQAVFGTGLFRSVRVQRIKQPEGVLDLVVEVEEGFFFEVEYGGGYGTDTGFRAFVGAKWLNLDGRGRSLSGRILESQREQDYVWDLREPWIFGNRWKWEGGLTGSHLRAERESFSLIKTALLTSINRTLFERSTISFQYELSRDKVFDVLPGAVLSAADQGGANIAAARAVLVLDFRDDPFNPTKGAFNSGTIEAASVYLGSEVDYYKLAGQSSWYFPLFRRNTVVVSGRAGVIRPARNTAEVPIQKRFFLGGRTSVRGFKEESLGPKAADGTPTGGDYMLNTNVELRIPMQYGFLLAGFFDTGSVWFSRNAENGFDLRKSAGTGLRYLTPIGPVSLDFGWKLDRREGESPYEWHFTIGAIF